MERKSENLWEEHFPHDSITGDIHVDRLTIAGQNLQVVARETYDQVRFSTDLDLAQHLMENDMDLLFSAETKVLVLDCQGCCLTAVAALKAGTRRLVITGSDPVHIQHTVWPSVFLNCPSEVARVRALSVQHGDWTVHADKAREAAG